MPASTSTSAPAAGATSPRRAGSCGMRSRPRYRPQRNRCSIGTQTGIRYTLHMSVWLQHIGCVVAFTAVMGVVILRTRRARDAGRVRAVELILVGLGLLASAIVNWWWLRPAHFIL